MHSTKFIRNFQMRYEMIPDGCWEWYGPFDKDGYGTLKRFGKTLRAHRVSYEIHTRAIPAGLMVMHSCDNPSCVNPAHLSAGTAQQNNDDMARKGRKRVVRGSTQQRGSRNAQARLTILQVIDIRCRAARGESPGKLADEFGVTASAVQKIVTRKTWKHV